MHHIKPMIISQTGKRRPGKGFSPDEIKEAGLDAGSTRKLGISIDRKRKTNREENVKVLKALGEKAQMTNPKLQEVQTKKKPKN